MKDPYSMPGFHTNRVSVDEGGDLGCIGVVHWVCTLGEDVGGSRGQKGKQNTQGGSGRLRGMWFAMQLYFKASDRMSGSVDIVHSWSNSAGIAAGPW